MGPFIRGLVRLFRGHRWFQKYVRYLHFFLFNSNNIYFATNGEAWLAQRISKYSSSNSLILDIGCNEGEYLALFFDNSYEFKGKVIAVDPMEEVLIILKERFGFLGNRISVHSTAISNISGTTFFHKYVDSTFRNCNSLGDMNSIGVKDEIVKSVINVKTIPDLLKDYALELCDVFILKLDIEGAEFLALEGARSLLGSNNRPHLIQFEFGISARAFNFYFFNISNLLHEFSYDIFVLGESYLMRISNPVLIDNLYEYGNFIAISSSIPKELFAELIHNVKTIF